MKHKFIFVPVALASLALAGCSDNDVDDEGAATDMAIVDGSTVADGAATTAASDHATQFLTEAMKGDNSEVRVGKLAAEKGATAGVKDYGEMLANDHGTHLTKVQNLAQSMSVPVTKETKPEADELYAKLQGLSGAEFDKAFLAGMVKDHEKDIAAYKQEASSSDAAPLTDLAKQTVPVLEKHLETAQSLQKGG